MIKRMVIIPPYRNAATPCARFACLTAILLLCIPRPLPAADPTAPRRRYSTEYLHAVQDASEAFDKKDFNTVRAKLDEADSFTPNTAIVANFRGALALDAGRWDEAEKWFNEAARINPRLFAAQFNLVEIPFRQKRYAEAREQLQTLRRKYPREELIAYKIYLTFLLEKNDATAETALSKLKFPGDSPAYYYAHAAWEKMHGRDADAVAWLKPARGIFSEKANAIFSESLARAGLMPDEGPAPAASPAATP